MTDVSSESKITTATFRFASGEILTLEENQIEKVPYLAAMVSSADRFESARDNDGHYKLDPHINYQHFSFVLHSLSFHSVRQLFTCLPEENNAIPIIVLLDFLGLGPQPNPTLNDVDSTFFASVVYSPLLEKQVRIVRPLVMQDMAVRFAIAMVKEEYNLAQCEVMDQIYWFVMFILSTRKWFGPRLRYHVCKTAENYFALFNPSLLESLRKLELTCDRETRKCLPILYEEDARDDEENNNCFRQTFYVNFCDQPTEYPFHSDRSFRLKEREELLHPIHEYDNWSSRWKVSLTRDPLKLISRRVLEIMYEQLQPVIYQGAIHELRQPKVSAEFVRREIYPVPFFYFRRSRMLSEKIDHIFITEREILPKKIDDIFKTERVQEEIRALILGDIYFLTSKLKHRHSKLIESIREYEEKSFMSNPTIRILFRRYRFNFLTTETVEKTGLPLELLFDKLDEDSHSIVEEVYKRVLTALNEAALKQFSQWENTQEDIILLKTMANRSQQSDPSPRIESKKPMRKQYQLPVHKPLLKRQFKYSTR